MTRRAAGAGSCRLLSRTSEWRAAAVVEGDHPAVVVGVAVGADAERLGERAGEPDQEAARPAGLGRGLGQRATRGRRRRRTTARRRRRDPRATGCAPDRGRGPWRPARTCALSSASSGSSPKEYVGTSRGSSSATGSRSPGDRSPGLDPLAVGHPGRRDDRLGAGQQHDLVDGDPLLPRGARVSGDRPLPADVAPAGAGEQVGDDALALDLVAEVVADVGGVDVVEQRGARLVDGGEP